MTVSPLTLLDSLLLLPVAVFVVVFGLALRMGQRPGSGKQGGKQQAAGRRHGHGGEVGPAILLSPSDASG